MIGATAAAAWAPGQQCSTRRAATTTHPGRDNLKNRLRFATSPCSLRPIDMTTNFYGRGVLVTGGSQGIGLALARLLVSKGARVCIAARDEARLREVCAKLTAEFPDQPAPLHVSMDMRDPASIAKGAAWVRSQMPELDVLVNNAGFCIPGYFDELTDEDHVALLEVNYLGPVRLIRALAPHFMERRRGTIVNVTSMLGFMGLFGFGAYAASKFALAGYSECLRQDLLPYGVHVMLCYPPTTDTPGLARENERKPREAWALEGKSKPYTPEQVAAQIVDGIAKKSVTVHFGLENAMIWRAQRWIPGVMRTVLDSTLHGLWKKSGTERRTVNKDHG
ncbi:SDR family NAD(P)-dependent oxidoreductase [Polyangium aurulentum]|uniref:SDR family NAD(P)-dependent oxidoreductase n=1 Tax=Polyangium aurulentum TaxID=2567896 RepID=UPI0010AE061E|nr:SDR family oxidoreductase [Polyangium aurulentum]UQA55387.1 SDR family oxidoreductase [Polyangium aurulentum]